MAARVLVKIDKNPVEAALPTLLPTWIEMLRSGDSDQCILVAATLREIGPVAKDSAAALRALLTDENEDVRKNAATALAAVEGKPVDRKK
jgi:HEAT repeat protein